MVAGYGQLAYTEEVLACGFLTCTTKFGSPLDCLAGGGLSAEACGLSTKVTGCGQLECTEEGVVYGFHTVATESGSPIECMAGGG